MTKNQVSYQEHREAKRANKAKEAENYRSNTTKERETERSNKAQESIGRRSNEVKRESSIIGLIGNLLGGAIKGGFAAANDPSWYNRVGPLTKDTANLPFGRALYRPMSGAVINATYTNKLLTPGILTIPVALTIGNPNDMFAAMNVAATKGYTYIRSVNSGAAEGLPPDFIKYVLAVRSILAMYAEACKVYSISRAYSSENRYIGRALIRSLGFDPDTVYPNQAQFRVAVNRVAVKLGVIAVPKEFPLFARTTWMFGSTFKDSDSDKAQILQYRLEGYHRYSDEVGYLQWVPFGGGVSIMDFVSWMEDCVDRLLDSEFVWIQSGDILKAFGDSSLLKLPYVPEDLGFDLVYSEEVLSQFHNLRCVGSEYGIQTTEVKTSFEEGTFGSFDVWELDGRLVQGMKTSDIDGDVTTPRIIIVPNNITKIGTTVKYGSAPERRVDSGDRVVLDTYIKGQPTTDDVMVATRMAARIQSFDASEMVITQTGVSFTIHQRGDTHENDTVTLGDDGVICAVTSCGSEVALDMVVTAFNTTDTDEVVAKHYVIQQIQVASAGSSAPAVDRIAVAQFASYSVKLLSAWHYAPALETYFLEDGTYMDPMYQFEVNNSVAISYEVLDAMHDAALYSLFNLGDLGGFKSVR